MLEGEAFGGQAGTSSMIRNYLGFPRGITGRQLGRRAVLQATAFGAAFDLARAAVGVRTRRRRTGSTLDDGSGGAAHAVILACGVTYRRLGVAPLEALVGRGVFYGASTTHARALQDADVVVVGAGNSGGQAALHLARYAARVTIVARGQSLSATMSDYLVREIDDQSPNRRPHRHRHRRRRWRRAPRVARARRSDAGADADRIPAAGLFILIGTETRTDWLPAEIQRDGQGFVLTGDAVDRARWPLARPPQALETSVPGVFAAGDVRANNVKRVAAAVGEGSVSVPMVHRFLEELRARS